MIPKGGYMVNTTEIHEDGVSIVADRLRRMDIACDIYDKDDFQKAENDIDIIAQKNSKHLNIRVRSTLGNDSEYKYDLGKNPEPDDSLYYFFVLLRDPLESSQIFPFQSRYVAEHPCRSKSKRKSFYFYSNPYMGSNMRDDYEAARNNFRNITSYFR
jgi:hypothetical protein